MQLSCGPCSFCWLKMPISCRMQTFSMQQQLMQHGGVPSCGVGSFCSHLCGGFMLLDGMHLLTARSCYSRSSTQLWHRELQGCSCGRTAATPSMMYLCASAAAMPTTC